MTAATAALLGASALKTAGGGSARLWLDARAAQDVPQHRHHQAVSGGVLEAALAGAGGGGAAGPHHHHVIGAVLGANGWGRGGLGGHSLQARPGRLSAWRARCWN